MNVKIIFLVALFEVVINLFSFGQTPSGHPISACNSEFVDLHIYNGVSDIPLSDEQEYNIGAVTIANRNDTDGDGLIDGTKNDPEIRSADGKGENFDKDLMRLTINRPLNSSGNQKVRLFLEQGGSIVKVWKNKDKTGGEVQTPHYFKCIELPIDVFIETTTYSTSIRDITIRLEIENDISKYDEVRATSIWVESRSVWKVRCPIISSCNQDFDNSIPGQGQLSNLDQPILINRVADRISTDGSRYGHGYNDKRLISGNSFRDESYGGRILFEFRVFPHLTYSQFHDELQVDFDCTRRRSSSELTSMHGEMPMPIKFDPFPLLADEANDDTSNDYDEDNTPTNSFLYSWDAVSIPNLYDSDHMARSFKSVRASFEEFVRVGINETMPKEHGNKLVGSRASDKIPWHCIYYTRSGVGNILEPDNGTITCSTPKKNSTNLGSCSVELLSSPETEGYSCTFTQSSNKWKLITPSGFITEQSESSPGQWILVHPDHVKIIISKGGGVPFYNGDYFKFSIFKSNNKKNEISESSIIIDNKF